MAVDFISVSFKTLAGQLWNELYPRYRHSLMLWQTLKLIYLTRTSRKSFTQSEQRKITQRVS